MSPSPRKICVVSGSRAEYGLLFWLLKELKSDPRCDLRLAVTGMHLSPEFGQTVRLIEQDEFEIDARIESLVSGDSPAAAAKSIGIGTMGFADYFAKSPPEIVVLLGDRFEILSTAIAAMTHRIPVVHIHGGELTEGLIDESIRHAITKMSCIHFTSSNDYKKRVIQLGEQPQHVHNVGALGLEWLHKVKLITRKELERTNNFAFAEKNLLLVFHPETLSSDGGLSTLNEIVEALSNYDGHIFISASNADPAGRQITGKLEQFANLNPQKRFFFTSLGHLKYLSLMNEVDFIIGNSSSGLLEAPALMTPTINIGDRQRGRCRASSVIDCRADRNHIWTSIADVYKRSADFSYQPFGNGLGIAKKIACLLIEVNLEGLITKKFFDVNYKI